MKYFFLIVLLLVLLTTCDKNEQKSEGIKKIDVSSAFGQNDKVFLSEIADSISYIQLQSDSNCIIGDIRKPDKNIQFGLDRFFINDGKNLFSFNNSGAFLFKIGRQGKGPGEYISIDNFSILEKYRLILIYSAAQQKLLIYTYENKFVKSIKIDYWPLQLATLKDEYIVFGSGKGRRDLNEYFTTSILDINGRIVNRLIYREWEKEIEKKDKLGLCNIAQFYTYCDTLSYWEYQYNEIWRIPDEDHAIKAYYIDLGPDKYPKDYLLESSRVLRKSHDNLAHLWRFTETERYFFFRIGYKKRLKHILYDKKTERLLNVHHIEGGHNFKFVNDIDGGMAFWPEGLISQNRVFSIQYGYEVYRKLLKDKNKELKIKSLDKNLELKNLTERSNIADNPIIVIVYLKTGSE